MARPGRLPRATRTGACGLEAHRPAKMRPRVTRPGTHGLRLSARRTRTVDVIRALLTARHRARTRRIARHRDLPDEIRAPSRRGEHPQTRQHGDRGQHPELAAHQTTDPLADITRATYRRFRRDDRRRARTSPVPAEPPDALPNLPATIRHKCLNIPSGEF